MSDDKKTIRIIVNHLMKEEGVEQKRLLSAVSAAKVWHICIMKWWNVGEGKKGFELQLVLCSWFDCINEQEIVNWMENSFGEITVQSENAMRVLTMQAMLVMSDSLESSFLIWLFCLGLVTQLIIMIFLMHFTFSKPSFKFCLRPTKVGDMGKRRVYDAL